MVCGILQTCRNITQFPALNQAFTSGGLKDLGLIYKLGFSYETPQLRIITEHQEMSFYKHTPFCSK